MAVYVKLNRKSPEYVYGKMEHEGTSEYETQQAFKHPPITYILWYIHIVLFYVCLVNDHVIITSKLCRDVVLTL